MLLIFQVHLLQAHRAPYQSFVSAQRPGLRPQQLVGSALVACSAKAWCTFLYICALLWFLLFAQMTAAARRPRLQLAWTSRLTPHGLVMVRTVTYGVTHVPSQCPMVTLTG